VERFSWLWLAAVRDMAAGFRWAAELRWGDTGQPCQGENRAYPSLQANIHGTKAEHKGDEAVRLSGTISEVRQMVWRGLCFPSAIVEERGTKAGFSMSSDKIDERKGGQSFWAHAHRR
jgi:hypothetical protein